MAVGWRLGLDEDEAEELVAEGRVLAEQRSFARCLGCKRLYWEGSHTARMRETLERALGPQSTAGAVGTMPGVGGAGETAGREDER